MNLSLSDDNVGLFGDNDGLFIPQEILDDNDAQYIPQETQIQLILRQVCQQGSSDSPVLITPTEWLDPPFSKCKRAESPPDSCGPTIALTPCPLIH